MNIFEDIDKLNRDDLIARIQMLAGCKEALENIRAEMENSEPTKPALEFVLARFLDFEEGGVQ